MLDFVHIWLIITTRIWNISVAIKSQHLYKNALEQPLPMWDAPSGKTSSTLRWRRNFLTLERDNIEIVVSPTPSMLMGGWRRRWHPSDVSFMRQAYLSPSATSGEVFPNEISMMLRTHYFWCMIVYPKWSHITHLQRVVENLLVWVGTGVSTF